MERAKPIESFGEPIRSFDGEYRFLSNFWECDLEYEGIRYKSSEAAYQAQKTIDQKSRFSDLSPERAKQLGSALLPRSDWDAVKREKMLGVVRAKFMQNRDLADKLLATGNRYLEEANTWHDAYWGVDAETGKGENWLGWILMKVRMELRINREYESADAG